MPRRLATAAERSEGLWGPDGAFEGRAQDDRYLQEIGSLPVRYARVVSLQTLNHIVVKGLTGVVGCAASPSNAIRPLCHVFKAGRSKSPY